jgi:hypothetical protein
MIDVDALQLGQRYSRRELAALWRYRSWQAIARGVVTPRGQPLIVLFVTRMKQRSLPQYDDHIEGDLLFWEGEDEHRTDERIANAAAHGDSIYVFFREIHHAHFEFKGVASLLRWIRRGDKPSEFVFQLEHSQSAADDLERLQSQFATLAETERTAVIQARLGQGRFRQMLAELWGACAVTGVALREVLRASHIKPWRVSTNAERLDPYNGLLLLPNYDALFDRGLITFADDGALLRSKALTDTDAEQLGIAATACLRMVHDRHRPYLRYHRAAVFADAGGHDET